MSLSFDQIRLFVAIADAGSVAGGARSFGLTPSVASRKLAKVEDQLGVRLFVRTTRRLQLTQAGAMFLEWASQSVSRYENLLDQIGLEERGPVGLLRIACNDYIGRAFVVDAVAHFRNVAPGIQFVLTLSDDPMSFVEKGYDLIVQSGSPPTNSLVGRKVTSYKRVLCASPNYVAIRGKPQIPSDLVRHDCSVHSLTDIHEWTFRAPDGEIVSTKIARVVEVNSYPLLLDLAVRGMGVIRIAEVMARQCIAEGSLIPLMQEYTCTEFDGTVPGVWLAYPHRNLPSRTRLFVEYFLEKLRQSYLVVDEYSTLP